MWPYVVAGIAAGGAILYKLAESALPKAPTPTKIPPPGVTPWHPAAPAVKPEPSQGTATPHVVPGGSFVYTGAQASPADVQAAANALAAVDPTLKQNEQLVRNFEDAAGLAQRPGGPGWDQVHPTGTDGRYGHDVAAVLSKYVAHAPPPSPTRPAWWGAPGRYTNG